jgi:hypothetical protein
VTQSQEARVGTIEADHHRPGAICRSCHMTILPASTRKAEPTAVA